MQLHDKYKDSVVAISFNLDFEEEKGSPSEKLQTDVRAKLSDLAISCENYISSDTYEYVKNKFKVFLPAVLIFDKSGKLHKKVEGKFSYEEDVGAIVESLLKS